MGKQDLVQHSSRVNSTQVTFVDLFAGIGGFHLGIQQAAQKLGADAECVLAVDINEKARATYSQYFKGTPLLGDITDPIVKNSVPHNVDIICGGFPCQPFSLAGKKMGIQDDRGTLFEHIVEILRKKKPKAVFLENVRNLQTIKNNDGSKTLDVIKEALKRAGYPVEIRQYKATHFGLPTHRPRIYMVGFRHDILSDPQDFYWPERTHDDEPTLELFFKTLSKQWDNLTPQIKRRGWPSRVGNTIRVGGAGSGFRDGNTRRDRRNWDSYMFFENDSDGSHRKKPHTLSVHEAKAMMGFPYNFKFADGLTYNQSMKQLGNSVAVPVIRAIATNIIETIHG